LASAQFKQKFKSSVRQNLFPSTTQSGAILAMDIIIKNRRLYHCDVTGTCNPRGRETLGPTAKWKNNRSGRLWAYGDVTRTHGSVLGNAAASRRGLCASRSVRFDLDKRVFQRPGTSSRAGADIQFRQLHRLVGGFYQIGNRSRFLIRDRAASASASQFAFLFPETPRPKAERSIRDMRPVWIRA